MKNGGNSKGLGLGGLILLIAVWCWHVILIIAVFCLIGLFINGLISLFVPGWLSLPVPKKPTQRGRDEDETTWCEPEKYKTTWRRKNKGKTIIKDKTVQCPQDGDKTTEGVRFLHQVN
jgi:hypothetical protein